MKLVNEIDLFEGLVGLYEGKDIVWKVGSYFGEEIGRYM